MNEKIDFGNRASKILNDLACATLQYEGKPYYPDSAVDNVCLVFMHIIFDKMWDIQNYDNMPMEDRVAMAESCGKEFRNLVYKYTNIDTHESNTRIQSTRG
jgi:hypothetical protein